MTLIIYHNPRCSKSRHTLARIEEAGVSVEIVKYLDTPPTVADLEELLKKLAFGDPRQLMRRNESIYKEQGLKTEADPAKLLKAMSNHPKLIERPIVTKGDTAILGRPPENVDVFL